MDLFSINFEHFAHKPNFFPYFPRVAGKMPSAWAAPRSAAAAGSARRLDYTLESRNPEGAIGAVVARDPRFRGATISDCSERLHFWTGGKIGGVSLVLYLSHATGRVDVSVAISLLQFG